jgi:hypothetical protein
LAAVRVFFSSFKEHFENQTQSWFKELGEYMEWNDLSLYSFIKTHVRGLRSSAMQAAICQIKEHLGILSKASELHKKSADNTKIPEK